MQKKVILVADDEKMNRVVISKFFNKDFDVLEAENGKIALQILKERHVDMVLLDIIMPELNGIEVIEEIKKNPQWDNIGILVATSTKEKTERMALGAGADDIVAKPYDPVVIRKRMENVLLMKKMVQEKQLSGLDEKEKYWKQEVTVEYQKEIYATLDKLEKSLMVLANNRDSDEIVEECIDNIMKEIKHARETM